jgi:hypothetical protein
VPERRKLQRNRVYLGAAIAYDNDDKRSKLDCLVRNLTAEGAMITTVRGSSLPDVFDIAFPGKKQRLLGKSVWRTKDRIGVKFLEEGPADALEIARRLDASEAENMRLRGRIAQLTELY